MPKNNEEKYRHIDWPTFSQVTNFARRVAPVYELLKWKWSNEICKGIPAETIIAYKMQELLDNLRYSSDISWSSGGLFCRITNAEGQLDWGMEIEGEG